MGGVELADIKVKQTIKGTVKTLNKAVVGTEKLKENIIETKRKVDRIVDKSEENETNYAINKINQTIQNTPYEIKRFNKYGKKAVKKTGENIQKATSKIKKKIKKKSIKTAEKSTKKAIKGTVKNSKRTIKTVKKTGKVVYKTTKNTVKVTAKTTKKAVQIAKTTAKSIAIAIKTTIKLTILTIKAIIEATQALVVAIVAGGWIAVIIIIVVCLIGLLCNSIFGIFFASEDTGSTVIVDGIEQSVTMNEVISDLNTEFMNKIIEIQQNNSYDEYDINGERAKWKDILAIYSVKVNGGENETDVITINDEKVKTLKDIYWEMNEVSFTTEQVTKIIENTDSNGNTISEEKTITMLHITIKGKNVDEMVKQYGFTQEQQKQLEELTDEKYASVWSTVIYGSSAGSNDIVKVALEQVGNVGGQPYWSWYGFTSRVEWCACFVSWCANKCGYIESGIIPKFASCQSEGVAWFKTCGLWKEKGYSPKARRYNIF